MPSRTLLRLLAVASAAAAPASLHAQAKDPVLRPSANAEAATPVFSIGQPQVWQPYLAGFGSAGRSSGGGALAVAGVHHYITNPVTGLLGAAAEAYGQTTAGGGGGLRLLATSRALALSAGADWRIDQKRVDWMLSWQSAIRRGGILGHGTMVRVDWLPTRDRTVAAGITLPLWSLAGRTRTRRTDVEFPAAPAALREPHVDPGTDAGAAMREVSEAASLLRLYSSVFSLESANSLRAATARGRASFTDVDARYQRAIRDAFTAAAHDARLGDTVARHARAGLLEDVLLPFDREFGRGRGDADEFRRLTSTAHARFGEWLRDSSRVPTDRLPAVTAVHERWMGVIEQVYDAARRDQQDTRTTWMPLQLALAPPEYDEQVEIDSLIARAVERPFTDRNALTYLRSGDLPLEIARSIYAARDYHVLWTHDFAGRRERTKSLDHVSYDMVADAYLPALTAAVRRYDGEGRLPVYMILLDEYFYEPRAGRLWMSILENPLGAKISLPKGNEARAAHLRERQAELRAAVQGSRRLQAEAAAHGGERWLHAVVKVHVNITQPSDFSFRSHHIVPGVPFAPDNLMRDHRKIVFFDLNESDPYRGGMLLMGVGIGEHYASATWEDRGFRLRGPAALEVRAAARRLLLGNGFSEQDIPAPLREKKGEPGTRQVERAMNENDYIGRSLQVHNEVGFGRKSSSVVRALLYTLAEPGSVIVVPDPLWLSREWAGMLMGAALRGARVHVIAPAFENAPSPQAPLMALSHALMERLLRLRTDLAPQLAASGGVLRLGLFASTTPVSDAAGRAREIREGLARLPWLRELVPFSEDALAVLSQVTTRTAQDRDATDIAHDERPRPPQLHQKTQLVARPGAIAALVRQPGWERVLAEAMTVQSRQTARFAEQLGYVNPSAEESAVRSNDALLRGFEQAVPEAERKRMSFYFGVGTQNEDPRGLMLDGEATVVTSGFPAAPGLVDLYFLMARTTWIESSRELDRLLPPKSFWSRVARVIRPTL